MLTLCSGTFVIFTRTVRFAYSISITSPTFICFAGFDGFLFTNTRPISDTSFAIVLLFISLDTFKNLSNLILYILSYNKNLCYTFLRYGAELMKKYFLTLFLTFLTLLFVNNSVLAAEIKFAQITDSHYSSTVPFREQVLEAAINDINKQSDISFVIFTGDNIESAKEVNLTGFMKIANKLNKPFYIVIGNHDVFKNSGLSKERYLEIVNECKLKPMPKKPNYVFKKEGFVFIVVDGAKEVIPGTNGYYKEDTLAWLDQQLTKYSKFPVIICQHFPLVPPKDIKSHATYKADTYLDLISKHDNVIAVVAGHYHMNGEKMLNGVYHISSPSLLSDPYSYKIINIVTTKDFSPMIYTG